MRQSIPNVGKVLLVSLAKGGVGKLTVLVNLALLLRKQGVRTGLLDADVFGPLVPRLLNLSGEPRMLEDGRLVPMTNYGLPLMLMGYLVPPERAVAWRGLMVTKALEQLMFEVQWPELDCLVVDMPPGTGDVQLTIAQKVKIAGAVIVLTPQDIALIDAVKGINMFRKVDIPIVGMVQNMSFFCCPNCQHELPVFGSGGAAREAERQGVALLGLVPLHPDICEWSDKGKPVVVAAPDSPSAKPYAEIAAKVKAHLV